ncbi:MAG: ABC-2 transporter permease [Tissierellales bacterium]
MSIKINLIAVIYVLFISVNGLLSKDLLVGNIIYVLSIIIFTFVVVIYVNGFDDKYKSEVVLNSFPIDRRNIVRSKYITLIIFILISSAAIIALTNILPMLLNIDGKASASIQTVIIAANILLLFYSIYYPIYFKVGEGLRTFNTILWLLMMLAPSLLVKFLKTLDQRGLLEKLMNIALQNINLYLLVISLVIYYISLQISKRIYMKREF